MDRMNEDHHHTETERQKNRKKGTQKGYIYMEKDMYIIKLNVYELMNNTNLDKEKQWHESSTN